jgi:hypothetical protein
LGKMRLDVNALAVDSFSTGAGPRALGTVFGQSGQNTCWNCNVSDDDFTCAMNCFSTRVPMNTCQETCDGQGLSCDYSCNGWGCGVGGDCETNGGSCPAVE